VLQCVAVCCSALRYLDDIGGNEGRHARVDAEYAIDYVAACRSVLQSVAACCSVLQCVAVCCSALRYLGEIRGNEARRAHVDKE